jgi:hypothetical protein
VAAAGRGQGGQSGGVLCCEVPLHSRAPSPVPLRAQTTTALSDVAARMGLEPLEHVVIDSGAIIKGVSLAGVAKVLGPLSVPQPQPPTPARTPSAHHTRAGGHTPGMPHASRHMHASRNGIMEGCASQGVPKCFCGLVASCKTLPRITGCPCVRVSVGLGCSAELLDPGGGCGRDSGRQGAGPPGGAPV